METKKFKEFVFAEDLKAIEESISGVKIGNSQTATKLLNKNWSPLIVRKYQFLGWPLFVGMICDVSLSDLDNVVYDAIDFFREQVGFEDNIQNQRDFCGFLNSYIDKHYDNIKRGCVEGVAVISYWDKCFVSSLQKDFMVHLSCKIELFQIIQTLPHI